MSSIKLLRLKIPVLLALIVLISNPVWFLWDIRFFIVLPLIFILIFFLLQRLRNDNVKNEVAKKLPVTVLFFFFFIIISSIIGGFQFYLFSSFILLLFYPALTEQEKILSLKIITRVLAFIVFVSLIPWLIHTFLYELPLFGYIEYYDSKGMDSIIENYIIFIQVQHDFIIRFYSVFDEPGTLGTLSVFVLYGNKFNFKDKSNIIIFLGGIFTFSMAFYILFLVGIFIQNIKNIKKIFIAIGGVLFIVLLLVFVLKDNETFQSTVINRFLDVDSSLDSRGTYYVDAYYNYFLSTTDALYGKGRRFNLSNPLIFEGQTYKFFIIEFGIIGFLVTLITYRSLIRKFTVFQVGALILFFLSFLQRPFILQPWQILLFIIIISYVKQPELVKSKRKYLK